MLNSPKYGETFFQMYLALIAILVNVKTNKRVFIPRNNIQKHIIWISPYINIICNVIQGSKNYKLKKGKKKK